jgi:hypothetical protein
MCTYSKQTYRSLISRALDQGYRFAGFQEGPYDRCIYLRHDIDYSLRMALELAEINASMGVQGTFCLLLRSQVYNLLSHSALECAREIHSLGQRLALHYALPPAIPPDDAGFAELIRADFEVVRSNLPEVEPAFAWHNTTPEVIRRGLALEVPGMVNIYSAHFIKEIPYCSDSNMRYSVEEFERIIDASERPVLHLLFHPLNWIAGGSHMIEILSKTWAYIIREREQEMRTNNVYGRRFPQGMPPEILEQLTRSMIGKESE